MHYHLARKDGEGVWDIPPILGGALANQFQDYTWAAELRDFEVLIGLGPTRVVGCHLSHDWNGVLEHLAQVAAAAEAAARSRLKLEDWTPGDTEYPPGGGDQYGEYF